MSTPTAPDIPAVIDAHQWALLVGIDLDGGAHVMSSRVDRPEAARLLRLLADRFEASHTPATPPAGIAATEYVLGDRDSLDPAASVTLSWRRDDLWAVTRGRRVRNQAGGWEIEPIPSSRDDEFRARCYRPLPVAMGWARAILAAGAR